MSIPKVSVIIPTFNRAHLLSNAISSVLKQSFTKFELIVVDDASTDQTEKIISGINDPRIVYIKHALNRGGAAARNAGIRKSRGPYVAFLDSDDEWYKWKLEAQMKIFERTLNPNLGVVYCGMRVHDHRTGRIRDIRPVIRGDLSKDILYGHPPGMNGGSGILVRKSCFEEIGYFDTDLKAGQDWDLSLRLAQKFSFDFVDQILFLWNQHGGDRITNDISNLISGWSLIIEKHGVLFTQHPKALSKHLANLSRYQLLYEDFLTARMSGMRAVRACPSYIISYFYLTFSFLPPFLFKMLLNIYRTIRNSGVQSVSRFHAG